MYHAAGAEQCCAEDGSCTNQQALAVRHITGKAGCSGCRCDLVGWCLRTFADLALSYLRSLHDCRNQHCGHVAACTWLAQDKHQCLENPRRVACSSPVQWEMHLRRVDCHQAILNTSKAHIGPMWFTRRFPRCCRIKSISLLQCHLPADSLRQVLVATADLERERQMAAMVCSLENKEACLSCGS